MSDNPSDSSAPKNPNLPRHRASMDTEEDLWNLEDQLPTISKELSPIPEAKTAKSEAETVTRVDPEPSNHRPGLKTPRQPRIKEVTTFSDEDAPPPVEVEKVKPFASLPKINPKAIALTEDEIWVDFDHEEAPSPPVKAPEKVMILPVERPAKPVTVSTVNLSQKYLAKKSPLVAPPTNQVEPEVEMEPEVESVDEEPVPTPEVRELYDEEPPATSSRKSRKRKPRSAANLEPTKLSRFEIIASLIFLAVLLGGGLIGLQLFQNNIQTQDNRFEAPEFPVKGATAQVDKAVTYWRPPIKEGPNADPTQRDVILLPVVDITIDKSISKNGAIRVIFYDETDTIVGDIITREFNNQRFVENGASTLSFASTSGFTSFGEQEAYRANQAKPWTIKVYEGPHANAPSSSFTHLFTMPISTDRQ